MHDYYMQMALDFARKGIGFVEPNPPVGAVVVDTNDDVIGEGYHERFGEAHAEINAMTEAGDDCQGATLYVTLEPCSHHGKTPPCADAVIAAGIKMVVIGCEDPAPHVAGKGIQKLKDAGVQVITGICEHDSRQLIAPFQKLMVQKQPWVHAKWAMTLDGKIATRTGHSKWVSGSESRSYVHQLRSRMDAIITGRGTLLADDPELTARPAGPRTATRIVLAKDCSCLSLDSRLVQTIDLAPVLLCVRESNNDAHQSSLEAAGVEVFDTKAASHMDQLTVVLNECGRRQMTHVMTEAGSEILGTLWDANSIDEVHAFVSPKLVGGFGAKSAMSGLGQDTIPQHASLENKRVRQLGDDVLIEGTVARNNL